MKKVEEAYAFVCLQGNTWIVKVCFSQQECTDLTIGHPEAIPVRFVVVTAANMQNENYCALIALAEKESTEISMMEPPASAKTEVREVYYLAASVVQKELAKKQKCWICRLIDLLMKN